MSYTPDDQKFENPIKKILEGIKEFDSVVDKRMEANEDKNEWSKEHILEINELSVDLMRMRVRLKKLQSENR